jgi:two-component system, cell cycle response regulator DivK
VSTVPTKKILIVDDDPDTVAYLTALLEDEGYRAASASDGAEGLERLRNERPDLMLLDVEMPGPSGIRVWLDVQQDEELRKTPVIFVTGVPQFDMFDKDCRPAPMPVAVVDKPVNRRALLALIEQTLRTPHAL